MRSPSGFFDFGRDEFVVAAIALDRVRPRVGFLHGHFGIRVQRGGRDAARAVEENRPLMRLDDKRTAAATDQCHVERSLGHRFLLGSV